jgi:hypothetical protein
VQKKHVWWIGDYIIAAFAWLELQVSDIHLLSTERAGAVSVVAHGRPGEYPEMRMQQTRTDNKMCSNPEAIRDLRSEIGQSTHEN